MRFSVEHELVLFAESVRAAVGDWQSPLEPLFGTCWDERDDPLAERLRAAGWDALWVEPDLLGAAVAGAIELGRAVAPLCLVDEATLGAPLGLGDRVRHGGAKPRVALPGAGGRLELRLVTGGEPEATLDGTGTVRDVVLGVRDGAADPVDAAARLRAFGAATLGYLAGVADGALEQALVHVRSRDQFGAPLAALPAVQGRLAEAALLRDGLALVAWACATEEEEQGLPREALAWAGRACCAVTRQAVQVHGGIGFALESGVHRPYRRAKAAQTWIDGLLDATA